MTYKEYELYQECGPGIVAALRVEREINCINVGGQEKRARLEKTLIWERGICNILGKEEYTRRRKEAYGIEMEFVEKELKDYDRDLALDAHLINEMITQMGMTQSKFAKAIGVSTWKISKMVNGYRINDRDDVIDKIRKKFPEYTKMHINGQ